MISTLKMSCQTGGCGGQSCWRNFIGDRKMDREQGYGITQSIPFAGDPWLNVL